MSPQRRGARQMPAGVWSPTATAASVDADTKSRRTGTKQKRPPEHLAVGTLMDRDEEYQTRKALMDRARKGDKQAHAELWAKYRCTLEVRR